jgi:hypothetical protein
MSNIRLGDISFVDTADSHGAFWRGPADTEATLLCSVRASAIVDPEVRDKFHALAAAVAGQYVLHGPAAVGAAPSARWYDSLPCATCKQPQAVDVLHACRQVSEIASLQTSPTSGLPISCCRVSTAGVLTLDTPSLRPPAAARRMGRRY